MGQYSNGWGHLIVTMGVLFFSGLMLYTGKLDSSAVTGLLGAVISFWFMSGSVNRFTGAQQSTGGITNAPTNPPQS